MSLEHLIFLPPNSALALLLAVWPICRRDLQGSRALFVFDGTPGLGGSVWFDSTPGAS